MEKITREYETQDGRCPFREWLSDLKDRVAVGRVRARLNRVRLGNLGNCRSVGGGVWELKDPYGPGYRIYFGQVGETVVILLCGGDKSTQDRDIAKAKEYWVDFLTRNSRISP